MPPSRSRAHRCPVPSGKSTDRLFPPAWALSRRSQQADVIGELAAAERQRQAFELIDELMSGL